jgi:hypothetical protein
MAKRPINYTSRDFQTIKNDLENYAKRYYPTTFKDFSEASFGSLMLDMVAYVGDQLSFYADFQANESFLDSAIRYENIVRLSETLGYKHTGAARSTGLATFYILVPVAASSRSPDTNYLPILQAGTTLSGESNAIFTLIEDVDFANPSNEITVARTNSTTGNPTFFAVRASGQVVSGQKFSEQITVGNYQRFLRLRLEKDNVTEIISVTDSQGNEYYEVEHLSQDIVLSQITNTDSSTRDTVPYNIRTKPVPRRFVTEFDTSGNTFIQFGYGSADNLTSNLIADPADVVLNVDSKPYVTDQTFDPTNLIKTDKFGVVPVNTTLTVNYTANTSDTSNASVGTINTIITPQFRFKDRSILSETTISTMVAAIEVDNEEPILGDTAILSGDEIRARAFGTFASQNRAVTREDYISLAYRLPPKFGKIKRVNVVRDEKSLKRNLNLYILAESGNGSFALPNTVLKENVKTWLQQYKMINDTIDILSGRIINFGIRYTIIAEIDQNKFDILESCTQKLQEEYLNVKLNLGEPVYLSEIYKLLNQVPGVIDTTNVELYNLVGGRYSDYAYDITSHMSPDGRYLVVPQDAAAELLFPGTDLVGVIT